MLGRREIILEKREFNIFAYNKKLGLFQRRTGYLQKYVLDYIFSEII
jgi:hypothetical protein